MSRGRREGFFEERVLARAKICMCGVTFLCQPGECDDGASEPFLRFLRFFVGKCGFGVTRFSTPKFVDLTRSQSVRLSAHGTRKEERKGKLFCAVFMCGKPPDVRLFERQASLAMQLIGGE